MMSIDDGADFLDPIRYDVPVRIASRRHARDPRLCKESRATGHAQRRDRIVTIAVA
jgi:hypothetical protein